jgi:uncharacterized protein (TIGR02453 family)
MNFFTQDYIDFFNELNHFETLENGEIYLLNNNKEWFDLNRARYEKSVKIPFANFVSHMLSEFAKTDKRFEDVKSTECIFRINRDIRFSKNKNPYKSHCSAVISFNGKKSKVIEGVYLELSDKFVSFYAGVYEASTDDLYFIREGIVQNHSTFEQLKSANEFKSFYGKILGAKNKIVQKEFKEKALLEELLFNKQWFLKADFPASLILSKDLITETQNAYRIAKPLQDFFNQFVER